MNDVFGQKIIVSKPHYNPTSLSNGDTHLGPVEWIMMQPSHNTLPMLCVDKNNTPNMLNFIRRAQVGYTLPQSSRSGSSTLPFFSSQFSFLCLMQKASAMSFQASMLSVYALNTNGLVHPSKIAHINTAISTRQPHLFFNSKTKTNAEMGLELPIDHYNIFEETALRLITTIFINGVSLLVFRRPTDHAVSDDLTLWPYGQSYCYWFHYRTSNGRGFAHHL